MFNRFDNMLEDMKDRVSNFNGTIYGFEKELDTLYHSLNRYKKSSVLLIGKSGVGKTALVEKFCQQITSGKVPNKYKNVSVYELSLTSLIAGTKFRGQFEEKVNEFLDSFTDDKDIIIFIDEIHNVMGLGQSDSSGSMSFSETLKPFLARNRITIIGATTEKEYNKYIKKDSAFDRRFTKIYIDEPNLKATYNILKNVKKEYEDYYGIFLRDNELKQIVTKSIMRKGNNPDKALDLLEELCYDKTKDNE
jgi:ATP-dependent Clp protease ATP-binding subunit ClpA